MSVKTIGSFLKSRPQWKLCSRQMSICRNYVFADFKAALNFIHRLGQYAESIDHHPDIFLTRYRFVKIKTTTHSKKRLTTLDLKLAKTADKFYLIER